MILVVTEICEWENMGKYGTGKRVVRYDTSMISLEDALNDYANNYNSYRVISMHYEFDGECLDSYIVQAELT